VHPKTLAPYVEMWHSVREDGDTKSVSQLVRNGSDNDVEDTLAQIRSRGAHFAHPVRRPVPHPPAGAQPAKPQEA
jgi:hypothetical protein